MKNIKLFIFLLFISTICKAQYPKFEWAKSIGGLKNDYPNAMALDADGNIYIAGAFQGTVDFDPNFSSTSNLSALGDYDAFVAKYSANGNLIWAKSIAGTGTEIATSISIDEFNNVYTTGTFNSIADFDPSSSTYSLNTNGLQDIFILKLDVSGNFAWAKQIGGVAEDWGNAIVSDKTNHIYITGSFKNTVDLDPNTGVQNVTSNGDEDIFIVKLNESGTLNWAKQIGGKLGDAAQALTLDEQGNVFTTGYFQDSVDFDPNTTVFKIIDTPNNRNAFISKLDSSGAFVWAKAMGRGNGGSVGKNIKIDNAGNVYNSGNFIKTIDFNPSADSFFLSSQTLSFDDFYILKLDSSGNFLWANAIGSAYTDHANAMALDAANNLYLTGVFEQTVDFDPGLGWAKLYSENPEVYVLKLTTTGAFVWVKNFHGYGSSGNAIDIDGNDNIITLGSYVVTSDFNPNDGIQNMTSLGASDIFIQKMSQKATALDENLINKHGFSLYPNPSSGIYHYSLTAINPKSIIKVYNALGKLVFEQSLNQNNGNIDISAQASGLYFVKITDEENTFEISRIIKE